MWEEQRPWNVYHYSANNPIVAKDPDGKLFNFAAAGVGVLVGGGIGAGLELGKQLFKGEKVNWSAVGGAAVKGGLIGGAAGLTGGGSLIAQGIAGATAGALGTMADKKIQGKEVTKTDIAIGAAVGGAGGLAGGIVGKAMTKYTEKATIVTTVVAGKAQGEIIKKTTEVVASKAATVARVATSKLTSYGLESVLKDKDNNSNSTKSTSSNTTTKK